MPIISGESGEFLSSFEPEPPRVAERVRGTLSRAGRFAPLPGGPRLSQGFIFHSLIQRLRGPVDQLEDRYLGMVEAVGSNPTRSTFLWSGYLFGPEALAAVGLSDRILDRWPDRSSGFPETLRGRRGLPDRDDNERRGRDADEAGDQEAHAGEENRRGGSRECSEQLGEDEGTDNGTDAEEAGVRTLQFALLIRGNLFRHHRVHRRHGEAREEPYGHPGKQLPSFHGEGLPDESEAHEEQAVDDRPTFPEARQHDLRESGLAERNDAAVRSER